MIEKMRPVAEAKFENDGAVAAGSRRGSVVFLFLGELFLIPHLLPIALALARRVAPPRITLLVITSIHEEIVSDALAYLGINNVEIRRARGFRTMPSGCRETPDLPHKIWLLALNLLKILRYDVAVVAERTSLWVPRLFSSGTAFVYNEHGAGPHANFAAKRNRYATRILMPGIGMAARVHEAGHRDAPIEIVGYIKRDYMRELAACAAPLPFDEARPTVVYVPHWLAHKSSWWEMGEQILSYFARSTSYNLVLAPHIRLIEKDPDFDRKVRPYLDCANIHVDSTSFKLVDQSYTNAADIYLGDGSSQAVEYAEHPRPIVFLNPHGIDWRSDLRFGHWVMGDVVDHIDHLDATLGRALARFPSFSAIQTGYVAHMMGSDDRKSSKRAADVVHAVLGRRVVHGVRRPL